MAGTLELLLGLQEQPTPSMKIKIKRLSKAAGEDVVFTLQALTFNRVAELREQSGREEIPVQIVLAGVSEPDLKNRALLEKYKAITPAELVKALLLPGEVEDVARAVEELSGYRRDTVELVADIKKK